MSVSWQVKCYLVVGTVQSWSLIKTINTWNVLRQKYINQNSFNWLVESQVFVYFWVP